MRLIAILACCCALAFAQVRAGAAKRTVTPELAKSPVRLQGDGDERAAASVHDELWARCLALKANLTLVLCAVDSVGLSLEEVERIRDSVNERAGEPAEVVVAALDTYSAPNGDEGAEERYRLFVIDRVTEAALEAVHSLRPARLRVGRAVNKDLEAFMTAERPPSVVDPEVVVLTVADDAGRPIATLANWANTPATLSPASTEISADYPGYFYVECERRLGGVALLFNGAAGGVRPPDAANRYRQAERVGRKLAEIAEQASRSAQPAAVDRIEFAEKEIEVPVTNEVFGAGDTIVTVAGMFRLSAARQPILEAALVPGALFPELSVGGVARYKGADFPDAPIEPPLKKLMRAPFRMVMALADDDIGNLIPKAEWDEKAPYLDGVPEGWAGEENAVGPEAAPRVIGALAKLLQTGKGE